MTSHVILPCAGRVSEVAWLQWEYIKWDTHFKCLVVQIPQSKPGKVKSIVVVGGADRHCNIFLQLAEFLMSQHYSINHEETPWLFPTLCQEYLSKTISQYVKDMTPANATQKWKPYVVTELPDRATAGACPTSNRMSLCVLVVHVGCLQTHHQTKNCWASWRYCL